MEKDFKDKEAWDKYPMAGYLLKIWDIVETYVCKIVDDAYKTDKAVQEDKPLQQWMQAAGDSMRGNIKGLPPMDSTKNLKRVLTSLVYRVTAHGISRLNNTANPWMAFVGNFPPCLQKSVIPEPDSSFNTKELLQYMPTTGTIGEMITFYFTFVYSDPYVPFIPKDGVGHNLFYGSDESNAMNVALMDFRKDFSKFIQFYNTATTIPGDKPGTPQIQQWPMGVET